MHVDRHDGPGQDFAPLSHKLRRILIHDVHCHRGRVAKPSTCGIGQLHLKALVRLGSRIIQHGHCEGLDRLAQRKHQRSGGRHVVRTAHGRQVSGGVSNRSNAPDAAGPRHGHVSTAPTLHRGKGISAEGEFAKQTTRELYADIVQIMVSRLPTGTGHEVNATFVWFKAGHRKLVDQGGRRRLGRAVGIQGCQDHTDVTVPAGRCAWRHGHQRVDEAGAG